VNDFRAPRLTYDEEPNYFNIHDRHFSQVQNYLRAADRKLRFQFFKVIRIKSANQENRGPSFAGISFYFQLQL
jgi:hypothetical protein